MKIHRLRLPVKHDDCVVDNVTAVLKQPTTFSAGETPAIAMAHGAGGGVDDPVLTLVQSYLVGRGFVTLGFNFPYREHGRKVPDREPILESTVRSAVEFLTGHPTYRPSRVFFGGKSMGGRMASHVAAAEPTLASGLVLLAYPLHAPGRPDRVRDKHLPRIGMPSLFVSGTRDALAPIDSLRGAVRKVPGGTLVPVEGADHSFKMLKRSGRSNEDVWCDLAEQVADWLDRIAVDEPVVTAPARATVKRNRV